MALTLRGMFSVVFGSALAATLPVAGIPIMAADPFLAPPTSQPVVVQTQYVSGPAALSPADCPPWRPYRGSPVSPPPYQSHSWQPEALQAPYGPMPQGPSSASPSMGVPSQSWQSQSSTGSWSQAPASPPSTGSNQFSAASSGRAVAPNMIGDFFGTGRSTFSVYAPQFSVMNFPAGSGFTPADMMGQLVFSNGGPFDYVAVSSFALENASPDVDTAGNPVALQENGGFSASVLNASGAHSATFLDSDAALADDNGAGLDPLDEYDVSATYELLYNSYSIHIDIPSPSSGAVVGRMKIAENTSPMPRDRVFFNYSYFDNVPLRSGGVNVNRFSPGFEKTFNYGWSSLEARFPFAATLDSTIVADGSTDTSNLEFGNITLYLKQLFYVDPWWAWSAGLGIAIPTADDVNVKLADGTKLARIKNDSVHLQPFLGWLHTPNDRVFFQGFLQFDFDTNGNAVKINTGNGLQHAGTANDPTFLFLDMGVGYWMYRNPYGGFLSAVAPTLELHYNRSLQTTDTITAGNITVGDRRQDIQILNGVVGMTAQMSYDKTLTVGYAFPIGNGADQQFDGELRVFLNWFFGGSVRGGSYGLPAGTYY